MPISRVISSDGEEVRQARRVRVLVVDDEPEMHRVLRPALIACGYEPLKAMTGGDALKIIASAAPDVVILDLGLTDMDGKEVLRQTRIFSEAPIVILSARDDEAEKISALDAGANDYVEKPFAIGELLARVRAALRHAPCKEQQPPSRIEACGLVIDTSKRQVTKNGVKINLTPKEYDLLLVLARRPGGLVTHNEILTAVWGPAHQDDLQYLRVFIGKLRAKIEDDPTAPRIIETELGVGYRFVESRTDSPNE
jgi:two-component system KDP operon response regulator KdpE